MQCSKFPCNSLGYALEAVGSITKSCIKAHGCTSIGGGEERKGVVVGDIDVACNGVEGCVSLGSQGDCTGDLKDFYKTKNLATIQVLEYLEPLHQV